MATKTADSDRIFVTSSTAIKPKAEICINALCGDEKSTGPTPQRSILIEARSSAANKAITIAQIAKRVIAEKGKIWYQYTGIGIVKVKEKKRKRKGEDEKSGHQAKKEKLDSQATAETEEDEESCPFEIMETLEDEHEEDVIEKEDTTISIHLSNRSIAKLAEELGEQTNCPEATAKNAAKKKKSDKKKKQEEKEKDSNAPRGANVLIRTKDHKKKNRKKPAPTTAGKS